MGQDPHTAVHHIILVVDVERFSDQHRTTRHQLAVRDGLYRSLRRAFGTAGVSWRACHVEDRGDGILVLAPASAPKAWFVDALPGAVAEAVRTHNSAHPFEERIRLRMALHAGEVAHDEHGVTSNAVNLAFRLVDAPSVRTALVDSSGVVALIVSGWFFDEVVRHSAYSDPTTYRPVLVTVKTTRAVGWISRPDHPYPSDPSVLTATPVDPTLPVPRQLPAAPRCFVGRTDELGALSRALTAAGAQHTTPMIAVIHGIGGIGKTWLAVHWARHHLDQFPDGQLFVDLHGFSPDRQPLAATTAVRGFLHALGADPATIPVEPDAQAALYRSVVAGRRMLILLDNARNIEHVIPLLPGGPACTVLITSRNRLDGLVTAHGAYPVALDALADDEARTLLISRLGADRLTTEPNAATELVACCAGFPLALGIVAGRAETHRDFPLAGLAAELHETTTRLTALNDDPASSLPAVLSSSYTALTTEQATLFCLLGIAVGPDIGLSAAANLARWSNSRTHTVLRDLERVSLIQQHRPGRYRLHDLVRLYAAERAHHDQTEADRQAAVRRLSDYYLHSAYAGDRLLDPHRAPIELRALATGCRPHTPGDAGQALAWFDTEHACLFAAQRDALDRGWYDTAWHLAWTLDNYYWRRGNLHEHLAAWQVGLTAAKRLDDPLTRASIYRHLGWVLARLGRHEEALVHLHRALTIAEQAGDPPSVADSHRALARSWEQHGDSQRALEHATQVLRLYRSSHNEVWEARALNLVGWYSARLGHYAQARTYCEKALDLCRSHRDLDGEAHTLDSLGHVAQRTDQYRQALVYYRQALALRRDLGDVNHEADDLDHLGHAHAALGQFDDARAAWQQALRLCQAQHRSTEADRISQQLDALHRPLAE